MSQSSPSLLNSLHRFRIQKKPGIVHDKSSSSVEDKLQFEKQLDCTDSDYSSTTNSSGHTVEFSEASLIKPVQLNKQSVFDSEHSQNVSECESKKVDLLNSIKNNFNFINSAESTEEVKTSISKDAIKAGDVSLVKPLQSNKNNMFNSEHSPNESEYKSRKVDILEQIRNNFNRINSTVSLEEVKSNTSKNNCDVGKSVHSISDSEEEDNPEDVVKASQILASPANDDDDVVLVVHPRSRLPRPIVVSDDEDDSSPVAPVKQEVQNDFSDDGDNCNQQIKNENEPEVFVVDDDSNSVEMVESSDVTKIEVVEKSEVQNGKRKGPTDAKSKGRKKKKRKINSDSEDENDKGGKVFDSDADSDEDITDELTESKRKVLNFLNTATESELRLVPSVSAKKIEAIQAARPFDGWIDLVTKFQTSKFLVTTMLNGAQQVIEAREVVSNLMRRCERIATRTENAIAAGSHSITNQPSILNSELNLMPYQMVGLNWLNVMNSQHLSGILADEMGLGKTIQVIAFLAHLKETGQTAPNSPHVIVVPASTLENWNIEFEKWCPTLKVEQYYGSPEDRRWLRHTWVKNGFNDVDVVLTTYNMVGSCYEERKMFRVVPFHYVVFDEAHMLKNMNTQRYENLIHINAQHKLLLTGTPLQNNLLELMSLLVFVMPDMFSGKTDYLKFLFTKNSKMNMEEAPLFEQEQVQRAKRIMRPFVLRRLKSDVLRALPTKTTHIVQCPLESEQALQYEELCDNARNNDGNVVNSMTIMMDLRRMANHPLTLRYHYQDDTLSQMAELLANEETYKEKDSSRVLEDLQWMSDHQLHKLVKAYDCLGGFELADSVLVRSGKFLKLDEILPPLKANGHKVLIFSQFLFILDILEDYMRIRDHSFLRLDGSTPVTERQDLIDLYNQDEHLFVFLLTTKSGGVGINLTAADTVIIHDVDFNPYNDKQAEDRCHRMGQTRPVQVLRFVSKGTIEEAILKVAQEKLHLEREVTSIKDDEIMETINVAQLLRDSLGITEPS